MGGLFSAPSPPQLPPPPVDNTVAEEEDRRKEMIKRKKRGRRGLIATSPSGLLSLNSVQNQQHSLLGE